jgi:hypothetical protein
MAASPVMAAFGMSGILIESLLAVNLLVAVMPVDTGKSRSLLLATMIAAWLARPLTAWLGRPTVGDDTGGMDADWAVHGCCCFALRYARCQGRRGLQR